MPIIQFRHPSVLGAQGFSSWQAYRVASNIIIFIALSSFVFESQEINVDQKLLIFGSSLVLIACGGLAFVFIGVTKAKRRTLFNIFHIHPHFYDLDDIEQFVLALGASKDIFDEPIMHKSAGANVTPQKFFKRIEGIFKKFGSAEQQELINSKLEILQKEVELRHKNQDNA